MTEEAPKPQPTPPPAAHKVQPDPHRIMAWVDTALSRRSLQIVLIFQLVLLLVLLLGPRLWGRESMVARLRVGERAEGNIKAPRSYDYYPSSEQLERERATAAGKVLPTFDHQADLGPSLLSRIGRAFNAMVAVDAGAAPSGQKPEPEKDLEDRRLHFVNLVQAEVSSDAFAQLAKSSFSSDGRTSLLAIVGAAMSGYVVPHGGALQPFRNSSITIRHMVGGRPQGGEERVSNLARIKDLQEARDELKVQAPLHVAKLPPALSKAIVTLGQELIQPNLAFSPEETQQRRESAREAIQPKPITIVRGQVIIRDGDPITKEHIAILRALESWNQGTDIFQVLVGMGIFVVLLLTVSIRYASRHFQRFLTRPRDLLAMGVLLLGILGLAKFVAAGAEGLISRSGEVPTYLFAIPVAGGAMLVRLLISAEAAAIFATLLGTLCGMLVDQSVGLMVFYTVSGLVGAAGVTQVQSRSTILRAGFAAGLAGGLLVLGLRMFREHLVAVESLYAFLMALGGGVLSSFMTLALLPAMEWLFAYTTDVTLLELANLNHPLLRELILRAPGTYHHSMVVGSLSEAACEAIGANGLLARVACYYHDVGKMRNADYFAENFKPGENPHNRLKPSMSALIIRSHVKDTVELLLEHRVPELVIDTATQHHGQTLIEFFYHKAAEAKEPDEEVHEEDYRYPGPKPQSREAGVIMLADGVEAAARSLAEPTEDRLRAVVQRVINNKFTDGQLDGCDLTLRDLHRIARSFLQVLRGIYHQRPTYPWQQQQRRDETRRGGEERPGRDTSRLPVQRPERTERFDRPDSSDPGKTDKGKPAPVKSKGKGEPRADQTQKGKTLPKGEAGNGKNKDGKDSKEGKEGEGHRAKHESGDHKAEHRPEHRPHRDTRPTGPMQPISAQLASPAAGTPDAAAGDAPELAEGGNPDIKRLGLS
jgi:cyclic-di-AMP phosphodiesterase PgpH